MTEKSLVVRAEAFARLHHEGQFRKGEAAEPYITHVAEVASLVRELGVMKSRRVELGYMMLSKIVLQHCSILSGNLELMWQMLLRR